MIEGARDLSRSAIACIYDGDRQVKTGQIDGGSQARRPCANDQAIERLFHPTRKRQRGPLVPDCPALVGTLGGGNELPCQMTVKTRGA